MSEEIIPALPSPLESVRYQFEKWRERRKNRKEPIPEELWAAATRLGHQYSINHISRTLHLNYNDLKKRISGTKSITRKKKTSPQFVELDWPGHYPTSECVIEMENGSGAKMRMSFKGRADLDLLALGKVFWSKEQ
jgi:hypothetical protein